MFNDPTLRIFYALSECNQVMKNEYRDTVYTNITIYQFLGFEKLEDNCRFTLYHKIFSMLQTLLEYHL